MTRKTESGDNAGMENRMDIEKSRNMTNIDNVARGTPDDPYTTKDENVEVLGKASIVSSGANLLKTFIGAGIVSLPVAMAEYGYVAGVILMMCAGALSCFGMYLLIVSIYAIDENRRRSSPLILSRNTWPFTGVLMDVCISLKSLGVCLSYMLLIGSIMSTFSAGFYQNGQEDINIAVRAVAENLSTMPEPEKEYSTGNVQVQHTWTHIFMDERIWVFIFMFLIAPLSFLKKMDSLKYSSLLGLFSVLCLIVLSAWFVVENRADIFYCSSHSQIVKPFPVIKDFKMSTFGKFGILIFAFTCHQNIFDIYNESKSNRISTLGWLSVAMVMTSFFAYLVYGLTNYISLPYLIMLSAAGPNRNVREVPFPENTTLDGSMFKYYPFNSVPFQLSRLMFALLLSFSYPLQVMPYRKSALRLLEMMGSKEQEGGEQNDWTPTLLTWLILIFNFVVAMFKPNISNVLSLVGAMTSSIVCYILPALFYIKLSSLYNSRNPNILPTETSLSEAFPQRHWNSLIRFLAFVLLVSGMLIWLMCTSSSIADFFG